MYMKMKQNFQIKQARKWNRTSKQNRHKYFHCTLLCSTHSATPVLIKSSTTSLHASYIVLNACMRTARQSKTTVSYDDMMTTHVYSWCCLHLGVCRPTHTSFFFFNSDNVLEHQEHPLDLPLQYLFQSSISHTITHFWSHNISLSPA